MIKTGFSIRRARGSDAEAIAETQDVSWRDAYRGVIPGVELERMIARRGPRWWSAAIAKGTGLLVLTNDKQVVGYATYGRNRVPSMPYSGEIFEIYLRPELQGLGFGRDLFSAARRELAEHGCLSTIVWALAANDKALAFYRRLGGLPIRRAEERFGDDVLERVAFGFVSAPVK